MEPFDSTTALHACARIIAIASIVSALEFRFILRCKLCETHLPWSIVRDELQGLPFLLVKALGHVFGTPFRTLLPLVQLFCAAWCLIQPNALTLLLLFVLALLHALRWRGAFNGGSDSMLLLTLASLTVSFSLPEHLYFDTAGLWYISIIATLSYVLAGIAKIKHQGWRNGEAIAVFVGSSPYHLPAVLKRPLNNPPIALTLSWSVLLFELLFPVALVFLPSTLFFLAIGFVFHLGNSAIFGLNRFLLIWVATYPAIYFCAHELSAR